MSVSLPTWLVEALPELSAPYRVAMGDGGGLVATSPEGVVQEFPDLKSMHQALRDEDLDIADDVYEAHGCSRSGLGLSYPSSPSGFRTMVSARTDAGRMRHLMTGYEAWLEQEAKYVKDPTNFYEAYHFVDSHPAFWTRPHAERMPFHWDMTGYMCKVRQYLGKTADGAVYVSLEAGGHVPEASNPEWGTYSSHYADYRLEVTGDTFEQAVVALAANVYKFFDSAGVDRPDVEFEEPEWLKTTLARIAGVEADSDGETPA